MPEVSVPEVYVPEVYVPEVHVPEVSTNESPNLIITEEKSIIETPPHMVQSEEIVIDTEPSVHFSDYDNVFEEQTGTFEYNPKSDDSQLLKIMEDSETSLDLDDSVMNLEASGSTSTLGQMMADEILE